MTVRSSRTMILLAVVLVSLNMRGAIAAVPPILGELTADLGITTATAGLLTSLPLLFFALAAPLSAVLGRRLGPGRAVLVGIILILVGTLGRVLGGVAILFIGTAIIGLGITIANILVPVVIKRDFAHHASRVTGYFVATMSIGATLAAGLAVPLAHWLGWRGALASWSLLLPVAALGWWLHIVRRESIPTHPGATTPRAAAPAGTDATTLTSVEPAATITAVARPSDRYVWRLLIPWAITIVLGCQSALFYTMTTWIPTILTDRAGLSPAVAGTALSIFLITAIPTALTVAALCRLRPSQGWIGVLNAVGWIAFIVGLLYLPDLWMLWAVIGGLVQGGGFTYALTLMVLRGGDEHVVRAISGMSQLIGYSIAAIGPWLVGWLAQETGSWPIAGNVLIALALAMGVMSLIAGRNETVRAPA